MCCLSSISIHAKLYSGLASTIQNICDKFPNFHLVIIGNYNHLATIWSIDSNSFGLTPSSVSSKNAVTVCDNLLALGLN